jgi:hypothetical protein
VALDRPAAVVAVREVKVGSRARVLDAHADHGAAREYLASLLSFVGVAALSLWDDELLRLARSRRECLVALAVLWPQNIVGLADA